MDFEEAKQYRDSYIQDRKDAGVHLSDVHASFYISSTIKDQGKTGRNFGTAALCSPILSRDPAVCSARVSVAYQPQTVSCLGRCQETGECHTCCCVGCRTGLTHELTVTVLGDVTVHVSKLFTVVPTRLLLVQQL